MSCKECKFREWMNNHGENINENNCPIKNGCERNENES